MNKTKYWEANNNCSGDTFRVRSDERKRHGGVGVEVTPGRTAGHIKRWHSGDQDQGGGSPVAPKHKQLGMETVSVHDSGACRRCTWMQTTGNECTQQPAPMPHEFPACNRHTSHASLLSLFSSSGHHTLWITVPYICSYQTICNYPKGGQMRDKITYLGFSTAWVNCNHW